MGGACASIGTEGRQSGEHSATRVHTPGSGAAKDCATLMGAAGWPADRKTAQHQSLYERPVRLLVLVLEPKWLRSWLILLALLD